MSEIAIRVEHLSKQYRIGAAQAGYRTMRETMVDLVQAPLRRATGLLRGHSSAAACLDDTIWALQDISFEVRPGEVVGLIGRNGSGKSTLLKVLSRITDPTEGMVEIHGRVGSLLEVGTGFHPELTGRENIYLNGAILGMSRAEIVAKFAEIVEFAEVERFIDTPVKHYSSGMYLRLAFAVAAHLEPEILLVDEVLAVGDAAFQKKCLGKMGDVARQGRTVLFVSHNMTAVQSLCGRGLVIDAGKISFSGNTEQAIAHYLHHSLQQVDRVRLGQRRDRKGNQEVHFTDVEICNSQGYPVQQVLSGQDVTIRFRYEALRTYRQAAVNLAFNVYNETGILLTNLSTRDGGAVPWAIHPEGWFECLWPSFNLRAGSYLCTLYCEVNGTVVDWIQDAFQIRVEDGDFYGTGSMPHRSQGDVLIRHTWRGGPSTVGEPPTQTDPLNAQ